MNYLAPLVAPLERDDERLEAVRWTTCWPRPSSDSVMPKAATAALEIAALSLPASLTDSMTGGTDAT